MAQDLVGKMLGDYRLTQMIGEGGMATVYKAYQMSLNRDVAIKILYHQEENSLIRFQREAKAIAALRHRNILIIYEYGEQDKLPFIAMEYVAGGTLEDRLTGEPMDWRRVIELAIPIAEALQYAHSHGIIHRDIKPSNILMPQEDWPVLADFGLVKRFDEEKGLTLTGTFMGTPSYIAPEQARDVAVNFKADMYSLGVIMFEMITGEIPFDYENPNKILLAHVMEEPPRPSALNPECPPALEAIILKALAKSPADRFTDMRAMVQAMRAALDAPDKPNVTQTPVPAAAPVFQESEPEPEPAEGPSSAGFGGFFKRMFGGKQEEKPKKKEDTASKTAPQELVAVGFDDEADSTIQLNLGSAAVRHTPRIVVQENNATIILPEDKPELIMGRTYGSSNADVDLEPHGASKHGVSRRHAKIIKQGEKWLLDDLNSLNGTFIKDVQIKPGQPVALENGDLIRLSQMKLVFLLD